MHMDVWTIKFMEEAKKIENYFVSMSKYINFAIKIEN